MGTEMTDFAAYSDMQKGFYNEAGDSPEQLVGNYDYHENFPYETNILHLYGDIRRPVLTNPSTALGYDIGCGEGRMIRRMSKLLQRVDGGDISERMVTAAKERSPAESNIYLTTGGNCGNAVSDTYDLVFNTISLHHICVYDIRAAILQDITRILKPDGCATLQFFFSKYYPYCRTHPPMWSEAHMCDLHHRDKLMADWFENRWEAQGTNSDCDAAFGTDHIPAVLEDFKKWFEQVDVWFVDVSIGRPDSRSDGTPRILPEIHPNTHMNGSLWFTHMAFFHLRGPIKSARSGLNDC